MNINTILGTAAGGLGGFLLGGPAGALAGAGLGGQIFGQEATNQTNIELANQTNAFNAAEAERSRQWSAEMSNTAHQREAKDLVAAGLNPLLAANGGASTPGAATATGAAPKTENSMQGLMAEAMAFKQLQQQIQKQNAELGLIDAQRRNTDAQRRNTDMDTRTKKFNATWEETKDAGFRYLKRKWEDGYQTNARDALKSAEKVKKQPWVKTQKQRDQIDQIFKQPDFSSTKWGMP